MSDVVKSSAVKAKKSQEISAEEKSNDGSATIEKDITIWRVKDITADFERTTQDDESKSMSSAISSTKTKESEGHQGTARFSSRMVMAQSAISIFRTKT